MIVLIDCHTDVASHLGNQLSDANHALGVVGDRRIARLKAYPVVQRYAAE